MLVLHDRQTVVYRFCDLFISFSTIFSTARFLKSDISLSGISLDQNLSFEVLLSGGFTWVSNLRSLFASNLFVLLSGGFTGKANTPL